MTTEAVRALSALRLPLRPSTLRHPIPLFPSEDPPPSAPLATHPKHIVSLSISFHELRKLAQLEYNLPLAGPLFHRERTLLGAIQGTSTTAGIVQVYLLSDGALIAELGAVEPPEMVELERIQRKDDVLLISPSTRISVIAEGEESEEALRRWTALLPSSTPIPASPASLLSPMWTPDSALSACEACTTYKFTLTRRRHHCRTCGRGICTACSRFNNEGKRVCVDCYKSSVGV